MITMVNILFVLLLRKMFKSVISLAGLSVKENLIKNCVQKVILSIHMDPKKLGLFLVLGI